MSMISIQTGIRIARPRGDVFALLADPHRFPLWHSAVTAVEGAGPSYVIHRTLPTGPATNELVVVAREAPELFTVRTASGPTPFVYEYRLREDAGGTLVELDARVELGPLGRLAARGVKRGIDANLATLRDALERERA
jgi:carbon monoxide dehydrogenase subunit G